MKILLIVLLILSVLLLCGGGLFVASYLLPVSSSGLLPAAPTSGAVLLPTPTAAAGLPAVAPTAGAPQPAPAGAFNGTFAGTLNGDGGSSAPATLELTQTGDAVSGRLSIGDGLWIDGGNCGTQAVPPGAQTAAGRVDPANPAHLEASGGFQVQGFTIGIELAADISADGGSLATQARLALPFLCGREPIINGAFARQ